MRSWKKKKLFHEIAKLRYEIEAIRKQHQLPDLYAPAAAAVPEEARTSTDNEQAAAARPDDRSFMSTRIRLALPDIPELNLVPFISAIRLKLARPPVSFQRMIWCAQWLAAMLLGGIAGTGVLMSFLPRSSGELAQVIFLPAVFMFGVYQLAVFLYNAGIGAVAYVLAKRGSV